LFGADVSKVMLCEDIAPKIWKKEAFSLRNYQSSFGEVTVIGIIA